MLSLFAISFLPFLAAAQSWTSNSTPSVDWYSLASSADGSRLLAGGGSSVVYSSTNAGATWVTNPVPSHTWAAVASSADGSVLAAAVGYPDTGKVYISTNAGAFWTNTSLPSKQWTDLTMSADGAKIIAIVSGGMTYSSTDTGNTWVSNGASVFFPSKIVSSADGNTLALALRSRMILSSTNFGASWVTNTLGPFLDFPCVAASASGQVQMAGAGGNGGNLFVSTNWGVNWSTNLTRQVWQSIAISADGHAAIASGYPAIYTTTNFGQTWVSNDTPKISWYPVATSADGSRLVAAGFPSSIYTWQATPTPAMNINLAPGNAGPTLSWVVPATNFVLQQSSDFINWSNVPISAAFNSSNVQNQVTLPVSGVNGFFRLRTP